MGSERNGEPIGTSADKLVARALRDIPWAECGALAPEIVARAAFRWAARQVDRSRAAWVPPFVIAALLPDVDQLVAAGILQRLADGRVLPASAALRRAHGDLTLVAELREALVA